MGIYFFILILICIALVACINEIRQQKNIRDREMKKTIFHLVGTSIASVLSTIFLMLASNVIFAGILINVYFMFVTWLALFMLKFTSIYTSYRLDKTKFFMLILILTIVDSICLVINIFKNIYFDISMNTSYGDFIHIWKLEFYTPVYISIVGSYVIALITMGMLLKKVMASSNVFKAKYSIILWAYVVIGGANIFSLVVARHAVDYSVAFYSLLVLFMCRYAYKGFPKRCIQIACEQIVQENNEIMLCFDERGSYVWGNGKAHDFFDLEVDDNIGRLEKIIEGIADSCPKEQGNEFNWEGDWKEGDWSLNFKYSLRYLEDKKGRDVGIYLLMEDITKEVEQERIEKHRITHDSLTGLLNRDGFFSMLEKICEKRKNNDIYMVSVNIRDFKLMNDLFGTEFCDDVLRHIAELISEMFWKESICGRIGGDKFAVACSSDEFEISKLKDVSEQLQEIFAGKNYNAHICFGICQAVGDKVTSQNLYNNANLAIRSIQGEYNNIYAYYDEKLRENIIHEKALIDDLDVAMEENQFCFYLQPQVNSEGNVLGAEALVRWNHPTKGFICPGDFIPLYENRGLIHKLDAYVWEQVVRKLRKWRECGNEDYYISINISAKDFFYMDIYSTLTSLVTKYHVQPASLKLEITESALNSDITSLKEVLKNLKEFGFIVELDDFGSGYSSLNSLKDIPADVIKLDREFIADTENTERRRDIVEAVTYMGKKLGMEVIAEGVETAEQLERLSMLGIDVFQGFYFYKPMPVEEFEEAFF